MFFVNANFLLMSLNNWNKNRREFFFRLSETGGALAVIFFPVSVSLSQFGLFLAILGWILWRTSPGKGVYIPTKTWELPFVFPLELKVGIFLYITILFSLLVRAGGIGASGDISGMVQAISSGLRDEFKDIGLISMGFWVLAYTADERGRKKVYSWLKISLMILLVSGFVAIFSKYRLSKIPYHLMHGWEAVAAARYQHLAASFFTESGSPFFLYMPIGFMGTHLTYAALLGYFTPYLFFRSVDIYLNDGIKLFVRKNIVFIVMAATALIILILNNGRSAIFGMLVALLFGLYYFIRVYWRKKIFRFLPHAVIVCAAFLLLISVSSGAHNRLESLLSALLGQSKHTDWQRTFVWQGTLDIIGRNPILGVGSGGFKPEIEQTILHFSEENPRLWYAYSVIQRGHAHNDLFHFQSIGGIFASAAYLFLFALLARRALLPVARREEDYWKWSALTIFASGLFQCYFQDDEVLLPFWIFAALLIRTTGVGKNSISDES